MAQFLPFAAPVLADEWHWGLPWTVCTPLLPLHKRKTTSHDFFASASEKKLIRRTATQIILLNRRSPSKAPCPSPSPGTHTRRSPNFPLLEHTQKLFPVRITLCCEKVMIRRPLSVLLFLRMIHQVNNGGNARRASEFGRGASDSRTMDRKVTSSIVPV